MISISGKNIKLKSNLSVDEEYYDFYDVVFSVLLKLRGLTIEILDTKLKNLPSYELLPNIDKATNRLLKAIKNQEKIILYGDYDVDGITSTTIMYDFLKQIGAEVIPVLPNRNSGYGLSKELIDLFSRYANLILTLDNGTTAIEEIAYAKDRYNLDIIVLDHHKINQEAKENKAILVNPNLLENNSLNGLCTAGLSFYMIGAIRRALNVDIDIRNYLDLVALGTVADVMPINHINRILIAKGLELINKIKDMHYESAINIGKAGMKALINYIYKSENTKLTTKDIGFFIAPRINAAGRIRKPSIALKLLSEKNYEKAKFLANTLNDLNKERKRISNLIFKEAYSMAIQKNDDFIILGSEKWHHGVLGIVAGRLSNKLKKPTGIFYVNDTYVVGSVRSVDGLDIHKLLSNLSHMFVKWGGHAGAAGITMKKELFEDFKIQINQELSKQSFEVEQVLEVDMELPLKKVYKDNSINPKIMNIINMLSPFGELNPEPVFLSEEIVINAFYTKAYGVKIKSFINKNQEIELNCFDEDIYSNIQIGQRIKAIYTIDSYGVNLIDAVLG